MSGSRGLSGPWNDVWLYEGVGMFENIWLRGDRTSSADKLLSTVSSTVAGPGPEPALSPKILSKSVRNIEKTGAGMFKVGANTIPTFRTVILFTSELLTISMRNSDRARSNDKFGFGNWRIKALKARTFFCRSSSSISIG